MSEFIPWTEKYRPKTLKEIVGHDHIVKQLMNMVEKKNIPPLLFYGPPGTGKTTVAWALARDLLGEENLQTCVKELNASDSRRIEDIREKVIPFTETLPIGNVPFKILIMDECEQMTNDAQHALRVPVERGTARFIFCANDASKIIEPLRSRCREYRFAPIPPEYMKRHLEFIVKSEGLKVEPGAIELIIENSNGDMRHAITVLQSSVGDGGVVTKSSVLSMLEFPSETTIEDLLATAMTGNYDEVYKKIGKMIFAEGWDPTNIVKAISRYLGKSSCKIPNHLRLRLQEKLLEVSPFDKEIQLNSVMAFFTRISDEKRQIYKCSKCGQILERGTNRCPRCGVELVW